MSSELLCPDRPVAPRPIAALLIAPACWLLSAAVPAQLFPGGVFPSSPSANAPIVGDLNGDGHEDVVVRVSLTNALRVFLSDGELGLVQLPDVPAPNGVPAFVGDVTGDGFPDVVSTASTLPDPLEGLYVFAGDGTGALAPGVTHVTDFLLRPAILTEVNGDAIPDLLGITLGSGIKGVGVLLGDGQGSWLPELNSPAVQGAGLLATGDLNEDGHLDVVLATMGTCCPDFELLLGDGTGSFTSTGLHPQDVDHGWLLTVGDVNGDSHLDVVSGGESLTDPDADVVTIVPGDGAGGFAPAYHVSLPAGENVLEGLQLFDVEPDGDLDVLVRLHLFDQNGAMINDGSGGFSLPQYLLPAGTLVLGAFDADRPTDAWLFFDETWSGGMALFRGLPGGGFDTIPHFETGTMSADLEVGDLDGDGNLDVVRGTNYSDEQISIQLGDGAGGLLPATLLAVPGRPEYVALGDLDEDGALDLLTANAQTDTLSVLLGDGAGGFGPPSQTPAGGDVNELKLADFDGDGHLDVFAARETTVVLFKGHGNGALTGMTVGNSWPSVTKIDLADIDHDGDPDAVGDSDVGVTVWRGDGSFGFQSITAYPIAGLPQAVVFADVNLDGDQDLLATMQDGNYAVLLGDGAGGFAAPLIQSGGSGQQSRSLDVADVSGDGWPDLILSRDSQNRVFVLLGDGTGQFTLESAGYVMGDSPQPVVAIDFDDDGRPDLLGGGGWTYTSILKNLAVPFPWKQLGHALPGAIEAPTLHAHGTLAPGSTVSLALVNAKPLSLAYLIASHTNLSAPFKGGVLVPLPSIAIPVGTNAAGGFALSGTVPPFIPPAFTHFFQVWVADSTGPAGFTASNGLSGTTPD